MVATIQRQHGNPSNTSGSARSCRTQLKLLNLITRSTRKNYFETLVTTQSRKDSLKLKALDTSFNNINTVHDRLAKNEDIQVREFPSAQANIAQEDQDEVHDSACLAVEQLNASGLPISADTKSLILDSGASKTTFAPVDIDEFGRSRVHLSHGDHNYRGTS
ncbi:hypothetical protein H4Q26_004453 [Puccinia striiformis f. sp. tritici PST-130]|nr:hypothetical protein H4Q26_004453 [Puccinia striiformis f. sp. tritici PST-130]